MSAPDMSSPMVRCQNLTKRFGATTALHELSLDVHSGEFVVLLGPSGCGKTTALRLIAGFDRPDAGTVEIGDHIVESEERHVPPEARRVGMVFQNYALFPHLTVRQNVAFGLPGRTEANRARVDAMLELVGLERMAERYPHALSGGEQQRVALARTLAPAPDVVLLDEPFSNLDAERRRAMRAEVGDILRQIDTTVILVTHDQEEAFELGDRIAVLNDARLEQIGPPETLYARPATRFVAEFVGRSDFLPACWCDRGVETEIGVFSIEGLNEGIHSDDGASANVHGCPTGEAEAWEVMLRPDIVDVEPDPEGEAVVVARRFNGMQKLFCLELPSGRRLHSLQPSTRELPEGSRVNVQVRHCPILFAQSDGNADSRPTD